MKKIFFLLAVVLLSFGCEDSETLDRLDGLEDRVAKLEELCHRMNINISAIESIISIIDNDREYITGITPIMQGDVEIGYTITFTTREPITIYYGNDSAIDGYVPSFSIKEDADGIYYWTLDGEWILDEEGNKLNAEGKDGEDATNGVTPEIKIENGYWWASYDNGVNWERLDNLKGGGTDPIFKDVKYDENSITFTLLGGTEIVVPIYREFTIEFSDSDIGIEAGRSATVNYTLKGAKENAVVGTYAQDGWMACVTPTSATTGTITVTAPNPLVESDLLVFANDGDSQTIMASINFVQGTLSAVVSAQEVPVEGGNVEITINTNLDYDVVIPDEAKKWLSVVETKSVRTETVTLVCAENEGAKRTATVKMVDKSGNEISTCAILQAGKPIDFGYDKEFNAMEINNIQLVDPYLTNVYMKAKNDMYNKSGKRTITYATIVFYNHTDMGQVLKLEINYANTSNKTYLARWYLKYKFNEDGTITIYDRDQDGSNATAQEPYLKPIVDYFCVFEYSSYSASSSTPWADNKEKVTKVTPRTFKLNYVISKTFGLETVGGFVPVDVEQFAKEGICSGVVSRK